MILLVCFGKRGYAYLAYNLAFSLKHFSPGIEITILTDGNIYQHLNPDEQKIFDKILPFKKPDNPSPGFFKSQLYDLSPYDETLFIDIDTIALQDISPIIESVKDKEFATVINGTHTLADGKEFKNMEWATPETIWRHYKLAEDVTITSTNTSLIWFKKNEVAKKIFAQWQENFLNPIPLNELKTQWGGGQPDELYLNVAMGQIGTTSGIGDVMFFGDADNRTFEQLKETYYLFTAYGGKGFIHPRFVKWYDFLLQDYFKSNGKTHSKRYINIIFDKHANTKPDKRLTRTQAHVNGKPKLAVKELYKGLLPVSRSVIIDSSKLIQTYPAYGSGNVRVTNWLNCSMLEFNGKIYFAYRMESKPWCTRTKIGLCLLDSNLQPIKESNVLLELHSDLQNCVFQNNKSFPRGFHVEDPRLFVFNNNLFISYTDGFTMGQAKINPDTLQASESFYLDKPVKGRTEKNWTFFEHGGKLLTVYNTQPHTIFEMAWSKFEEKYKTEFESNWQYGIIRGGTSPQRIGKHYISFFHSALDFIYKGQSSRQYFMGAYLFNAEPSFEVVAISKQPLLVGEMISPAIQRLNNKIYVVFPSGKIRREGKWIISFGYNDAQCRYIEITDEVLNSNLDWIGKKEMAI